MEVIGQTNVLETGKTNRQTENHIFLPGESPWTEEPGGLQYMGSHRVGHD